VQQEQVQVTKLLKSGVAGSTTPTTYAIEQEPVFDEVPVFYGERLPMCSPELATGDDNQLKEEERTPPKPANYSMKCLSDAIEDPQPEPMLIWVVPLVGNDECMMNIVPLQFLHAGELEVKDAMAVPKSVVLWRKRVNIDTLLMADLGLLELDQVVFYRGEF
jgi:hypothetical protein